MKYGMMLLVLVFSFVLLGGSALAADEREVKADFIYGKGGKYYEKCVQLQQANNFSELTSLFEGDVCGITKDGQVVEVIEVLEDGTAKFKMKGSLMGGTFLISQEAFK